MSYTSQPTNDRSMNGIISFDDGQGGTLENGQITGENALISGQTTVNKLDVTYALTLDGILNVNSKGITPEWLSYLWNCTDNIQYQIDNLSSTITGALFSGNNTWTGTNTYNNTVTFGSTVSGLTKSTVGLSNVDNTSDANKPVSTATQTALNLKQDTLSGSNLLDASYIGTGVISNTEYNCLNGVVAPLQSQIDNKAFYYDSFNPLDASYVGTGVVSNTEFNYLNGVTSAIQTQLDSKVSAYSPSNLLDASYVGTGVVSNTEFNYLNNVTSDIQTQLDTKAEYYNSSTNQLPANCVTAGRFVESDLAIFSLTTVTSDKVFTYSNLTTYIFVSGSPINITLPSPSTITNGTTIYIKLQGASSTTLDVSTPHVTNPIALANSQVSSWLFNSSGQRKTFVLYASRWTILEG